MRQVKPRYHDTLPESQLHLQEQISVEPEPKSLAGQEDTKSNLRHEVSEE